MIFRKYRTRFQNNSNDFRIYGFFFLPDYCYSADNLSPKGKDRTKKKLLNYKSAIKGRNYLAGKCFRGRVFVRMPVGIQFPRRPC